MIQVQNMDVLIPPEVYAKMNPKALRAVVRDIAAGARARWIQLASKDKSVFKNDYIRGIQQVSYRGNLAIITLLGEIPHILEDGAPALDMRTTLLGPNVPVVPMGERGKHLNKRGGYFRAIPFRHATPTAGHVVGQAMGSAYRGHELVRDAKKLGKEIYKAAKGLDATKSDPYGKTKWGGRLNTEKLNTYGNVLGPQQRMIPLLKPHHKTDIYQGMVKQTKVYGKAEQSQYTTFRTISTSVKDGWIRKPITARHYADQVNQYVQKVAPMSLAAFLESES